jgi:hypothetical protein
MARKISRPIRDSQQDAKPTPPPERILDLDALLTDAEKDAIRAKARIKIDARDKLDAEEKFLRDEMERLDREAHPEIVDEMIDFTPDLADFADAIRIDGKVYHHGYTTKVPASQLATLLDIQYQTHRHDFEITKRGSANANFYRRSREMSVSLDTGVAHAGGRPVRF